LLTTKQASARSPLSDIVAAVGMAHAPTFYPMQPFVPQAQVQPLLPFPLFVKWHDEQSCMVPVFTDVSKTSVDSQQQSLGSALPQQPFFWSAPSWSPRSLSLQAAQPMFVWVPPTTEPTQQLQQLQQEQYQQQQFRQRPSSFQHLQPAIQGRQLQPDCNDWMERGTCRRGNRCRFAHRPHKQVQTYNTLFLVLMRLLVLVAPFRVF
jgi:hypothetical protein